MRRNLLPASRTTVQQKSSPEGTPQEKTLQGESPEFMNWVATGPAIQLLRPAIQLLQLGTQLWLPETQLLQQQGAECLPLRADS